MVFNVSRIGLLKGHLSKNDTAVQVLARSGFGGTLLDASSKRAWAEKFWVLPLVVDYYTPED